MRRSWLTALVIVWVLVSVVILLLAVFGVIPWVSVSLVTVISGGVAGVRWWLDRRDRRVAEMRAADL